MKTKRVLLNIVRVFGITLIVIGVIVSIPLFLFVFLSIVVMAPGMKMWQWSADRLDTRDKEPIVVEIGCKCGVLHTPDCAK
jgi:type III secretory pathway component EscV